MRGGRGNNVSDFLEVSGAHTKRSRVIDSTDTSFYLFSGGTVIQEEESKQGDADKSSD